MRASKNCLTYAKNQFKFRWRSIKLSLRLIKVDFHASSFLPDFPAFQKKIKEISSLFSSTEILPLRDLDCLEMRKWWIRADELAGFFWRTKIFQVESNLKKKWRENRFYDLREERRKKKVTFSEKVFAINLLISWIKLKFLRSWMSLIFILVLLSGTKQREGKINFVRQLTIFAIGGASIIVFSSLSHRLIRPSL